MAQCCHIGSYVAQVRVRDYRCEAEGPVVLLIAVPEKLIDLLPSWQH